MEINEESLINAFDSHTHFLATGQIAETLNLGGLNAPEEIQSLKIHPHHFQGEWLTGFGWNHNKWTEKEFPRKEILDLVFDKTPVLFSRVDGHASWVNSAAIEKLKLLGLDLKTFSSTLTPRNTDGSLVGVIFDSAHISALQKLPSFSSQQIKTFLKSAQRTFNLAGFTHVRELSLTSISWNLLRELEDGNQLSVALEGFVTIESLNDINRGLEELKQMQKDNAKQLRAKGLKIFIDGSLGSKTAYLSKFYTGSESRGELFWTFQDLRSAIEIAWSAKQPIAVHAIGDEAADLAVKAAREVSAKGILGRLHLEHVELLRPTTIQAMKPLHVTCHMQPCHWDSDHSWVKSVIPEKLHSALFQWNLLEKNKIPIFFGSDSPVEPTSLLRNISSLVESKRWGIPGLAGSWKKYHQHPDESWCPSLTTIRDNKISSVMFNGKQLIG